MKNKHLFSHGKTYGLLLAASLFLFGSCAIGEDSETWESSVRNAQLVSPEITEASFSTVTNLDGSEDVKLVWPVVPGAGGYAFSLSVVDDPENPEVLVTDSIIDGCSVTFKKREDTKYEVSIKALGNEKMNNKEAEMPTLYTYSTLVPAQTIPVGQEIGEYINSHLIPSDAEQGFELEAGQTYYLNTLIDFGLNTVTFRGDKVNRPIVIVGKEGGIMTQGGLKLKFINFDCTEMTTEIGLLGLGKNPDSSLSTEALGYKAAGANQDGYVINNPVIVQECMIKNLKNSLLYGNKKAWSLRDFRVVDCIVQLNNSGSNSILNLYGADPTNGLIKNLTVRNSTFVNIVKNSSGYFIRYANSSNAQPKKIFGDNDNSMNLTFESNTLCKTMSNKDFGNNMPNTNTITTILKNNIFYDVFRVYQHANTQGPRTFLNNTIWGVDGGTPNSNDTGGRKDSNGNPIATEENPGFTEPFSELNLDLPNGGLSLKPTGTISSTIGDPRWLE